MDHLKREFEKRHSKLLSDALLSKVCRPSTVAKVFRFFAASVVLFLPGSNFLQRNVIHRKILFPLTYYFIHVIFRQWTFCIPIQPSCASSGCDRLRSEDLLTPLVLLVLLALKVYFRAECALPVFLAVFVILALLTLLPVVVLPCALITLTDLLPDLCATITLTGLLPHVTDGLFLDLQAKSTELPH